MISDWQFIRIKNFCNLRVVNNHYDCIIILPQNGGNGLNFEPVRSIFKLSRAINLIFHRWSYEKRYFRIEIMNQLMREKLFPMGKEAVMTSFIQGVNFKLIYH